MKPRCHGGGDQPMLCTTTRGDGELWATLQKMNNTEQGGRGYRCRQQGASTDTCRCARVRVVAPRVQGQRERSEWWESGSTESHEEGTTHG